MSERLDYFMARANAAYYAAHDPFNDFTTAPEISQVFGELIGLWAALAWEAMGCPERVMLVEAGPGRGVLMADALRAIDRAAPRFGAALSLHLVETSPRLIEIIRAALPRAVFHTDVATLPRQALILVANEFLDALPIRQFVRRAAGWRERFVAEGQLVDGPCDTALPDYPIGTIVELRPEAEAFVEQVGARVVKDGGAALLIDYGSSHSGTGDTLQAIRHGRPVEPTVDPGSADVTAHVDFGRLSDAAIRRGAKVWGPVTQGAFLAMLGIHERTSQLGNGASGEQALDLMAATQRLTAPEAMGSLFKVMAVTAPSFLQLSGFDL